MEREKFIVNYFRSGAFTEPMIEAWWREFTCVPCKCGEEGCGGWRMITRKGLAMDIKVHQNHTKMNTPEQTQQILKDRRAELLTDELLTVRKPVNFRDHFNTALRQANMAAELELIERSLGLEPTKLPTNEKV